MRGLNKIRFEIIPLAQKKLKRRRIPAKWVEEALTTPDQVVFGYLDRKVFQKIYVVRDRNMLLRVIVEEVNDRLIVITAYLTSQVQRYWSIEK